MARSYQSLPHTLRRKRRVLGRWIYEKCRSKDLCRLYHVSPQTLRNWKKAYQDGRLGAKDLHLDPAYRKGEGEQHVRKKLKELTADGLEINAARREKPKKFVRPQRVKETLFDFTQGTLGYEDLVHEAHDPVCHMIEQAVYEQQYNKRHKIREQVARMILIPRGTFKSTIGAKATPLWIWSQLDPNYRVLLGSQTQDLSRQTMYAIRGQIETNPTFIEKYGLWGASSKNAADRQRWTSYTMDIAIRKDWTRREPNISCSGIDVVKTGFHYDMIVLDDLHDQNNTRTHEQIQKVIEYYRLILSLLDPDGLVLVFGTRWANEDLYGYILEHEHEFWKTYVRGALTDEGELLYPTILSREFLRAQRARQADYIFSCQYLNRPVNLETAPLKKEWLQRYEPHELPQPHEGRTYMTIDPATSSRSGKDYSSVTVCFWDTEGDVWLLDGFRDRMGPHQFIDRSLNMARSWRARGLHGIGIETHGFQEYLKFEMERQMRKRRDFYQITELRPSLRRKQDRIMRLEPLARRGGFHIPSSMPRRSYHLKKEVDFTEDLLGEWEFFPQGQTDDILDCLAYQLDVAEPPANRLSVRARLAEAISPHYARFLRMTQRPAFAPGWGSGSEKWYHGAF